MPFGKALNAESTITTNNKRFTTYDRSAPTGLDYAVNRTYDNKLGRFTQVDPIGMQAVSLAAPQSLNLYTYCGNDPINHTDPNGLFFGSLFKWIGRIIRAIMIAIAVVIAVAVIFFPPATITGWGIAKALIMAGNLIAGALASPKIGAIIGIASGIVLSGPGIIVNLANTSRRVSTWQRLLSASSFVGSIANSLSNGLSNSDEKKTKRRNRLIKSAVESALWRLKNLPNCKKFIQEEFKDWDPAGVLKTLQVLGKIKPNNLSGIGSIANAPLDSGSTGEPVYLSDEWFDDKTGGGWTTALGMNQTNIRTLVILHELKHRIGTDHSSTAPDGTVRDNVYFNKGIAEHCFGVK